MISLIDEDNDQEARWQQKSNEMMNFQLYEIQKVNDKIESDTKKLEEDREKNRSLQAAYQSMALESTGAAKAEVVEAQPQNESDSDSDQEDQAGVKGKTTTSGFRKSAELKKK